MLESDFLNLDPTPDHINQRELTTLLASVLLDKSINFRSVKATLQVAWKFAELVEIQSLDTNTFSYSFRKEDTKRIISGSPWPIKGGPIVLKIWSRELS